MSGFWERSKTLPNEGTYYGDFANHDLQGTLHLAREEMAEAKRVLQRLDEAQRKRPWRYYVCIDKIRDFHLSTAPIRVLAGPNRGGKTTAGAFEIASIATGYHPIKKIKYPTPNITWAISLDHQNLGSVMRRRLFAMLPQGYRYKILENRVILPAPWHSEIWFKSVDSEPEKFQGEGISAAWFDEEPVGERGHRVFKEVYARRSPGIPLQIFMTFTPLQGLSWSWHYLWDAKSPERLPGVETFDFNLYDCLIEKGGFLNAEEVAAIAAGYDEYERKARVWGQYTIMSGRHYFDPDKIESCLARKERFERHRVEWNVDPGKRPWNWVASDGGELRVIRPPLKGHRYIIGVDPAGGLRHDNTVASVWDCHDMVEVAFWESNRMDPAEFAAKQLIPLGLWYNKALIAVESNGQHGQSVISKLQGKYSNQYVRQEWSTTDRKLTHDWGFRNDDKTRLRLLDTLTARLREDTWVPSEGLMIEMASFILTTLMSGKKHPEAQYGFKDDHIFAAAIALTILEETPPPVYRAWDHYRPKYIGAGADYL